jgi:putative endonuclease
MVAAEFLTRNGFRIIDRNVRVGRGEIDILAKHGGTRVIVEVKSAVLEHEDRTDPMEAFDDAKSRQVWSLARRLGVWRVDVVAVGFRNDGVQVRWVPDV